MIDPDAVAEVANVPEWRWRLGVRLVRRGAWLMGLRLKWEQP